MNLLALDTSTRIQSVALAGPSGILARESLEAAERHSETLLPAVGRVLAEAGRAATSLDAVAVASGPGSFTGLRVGLATAKGLALAAGAPLAGFSTLRIAAEQLAAEAREGGGRPGICVLLEAGRGQLYRGVYSASPGADPPWTLRPAVPEEVVSPEESLQGLRAPVVVGGEGCARRLESLRAWAPPGAILKAELSPLAPLLARLSMSLLQDGRFPGGPLEPNYIRAPDALRGGASGQA